MEHLSKVVNTAVIIVGAVWMAHLMDGPELVDVMVSISLVVAALNVRRTGPERPELEERKRKHQ